MSGPAPLGFEESLEFIYSFTNFERMPRVPYNEGNYDLGRFRELLRALGDPQEELPTIHIAGTKGKGSVAALTASIARAHGLRVGLYSSPHLASPRERITRDGGLATRREFAWAASAVRRTMEGQGRVKRYRTTFEILTAMAFLLFRRWRVDLAVLEVGMGGRLDSTNLVHPAATVITPVSLDHVTALGGTLDRIAAEKAGILKPGVPLALADQDPAAEEVIRRRARQLGCPVASCSRRVPWQILRRGRTGTEVLFSPPEEPAWRARLSLLGDHQVANASLACTAWSMARPELGISGQDVERLRAGLAHASWPGRFQILRRGGAARAWMLVDGAHNAASVLAFRRTLEQLFPGRRIVLVVGISANKPVEELLRSLAETSRDLVAPVSRHARLLPAAELVRRAAGFFPRVEVASSLGAALDGLRERHRSHQVVIAVVGSLFLAGEALVHLGELEAEGP